jgi:hypothetical protein
VVLVRLVIYHTKKSTVARRIAKGAMHPRMVAFQVSFWSFSAGDESADREVWRGWGWGVTVGGDAAAPGGEDDGLGVGGADSVCSLSSGARIS